MRIALTAAFIFCLLTTQASAEESYVCIADLSTGFKLNTITKQWETANFRTDNKYLISREKRGNMNWVWKGKKFGEEYSDFFCEEDFNDHGYLTCSGIVGKFIMNKTNLRYSLYTHIGFVTANIMNDKGEMVNKESDGADTPYMEIGKCSSM